MEEANLALFGCAPLLDRSLRHALVFDIGGGSTEMSCFHIAGLPESERTGSQPLDLRAAVHSIPIGVVTLAERFGGREVTPDLFEAMVGYVSGLIAPFEERHEFRRRKA